MRLLPFLLFCSTVVFGQGKPEILDFNSSKLNGSIPSSLSRQNLLAVLGKPTKTENYDSDCGLTLEQEVAKVLKVYYYGKTLFLVYDNMADLIEIDFTTGNFNYKTAKINLSASTTLQDLQKVYPQSVKEAMKENKGTLVRLRPCDICDGYCFLYFKNGRLVGLRWYEDC
jgi:hypothetical protein